jgi:putative ABC transport system permease protein
MHLVAGRTFTAADVAGAPYTVMVNKSFADRFWPGESPLGKVVTWNGDHPAEVVGVLEDAMYRSLSDTERPACFIPVGQRPSGSLTLVARSDPRRVDDLLAAMKDEVRAAEPRLTGISSLQSMRDAVAFTLLPQRIASWLLSLAGGLGMLLATVGLYGVMSFLVARRTREVGLRMALGARAVDVVGMVVARGLRLALGGAVVGLVLSAAVTRFLGSLLFGVSPLDASVFALMGLGAMAVAAVACFIPALRAASVDPAVALREE